MNARDWGLLVLLSLLWGAAFILTEVALRDLPPFTVVLGRIGLAAVALNLFLLARGQGLPREPGIWAAFFVMGALNNVLPFSLIVSGQVTIDGGLAAVLNATTPLFSLMIGHFVTRDERLNWHRGLGIALGILGVVILTGPQALRGLGGVALGQVLVLGAALSYACAAVFGRRFAGRPPVAVAGGQLTASALMILPLALVMDRPWTLAPDAMTWAALLGLSVFGTAAAYVIYFRVLASAGRDQPHAGHAPDPGQRPGPRHGPARRAAGRGGLGRGGLHPRRAAGDRRTLLQVAVWRFAGSKARRKRRSTRAAVPASSAVIASAGLWLTPSVQRTKSMAMSAIRRRAMASCPAPLNRRRGAIPSAATAASSWSISQGLQGQPGSL